MEKVTKYRSFDGQDFETEEQCVDYEAYLKTKGIEDLYKQIQVLKAGKNCPDSLYRLFHIYETSRKLYSETCNKHFKQEVVVERLNRMVYAKKNYLDGVKHLRKLRKQIKELKSKGAQN